MPDTKHSVASRRRNTALNRIWVFPAAVLVAGVALAGGSVWLACLVVGASGSLTGVLAARDPSRPRLPSTLLAPIPGLVLAGFFLATNSLTVSDLLDTGGILVAALLLFDIPVAVAFRYMQGRRDERPIAPAGNLGLDPRDPELDLATDHGRATTVVREYLDDSEGRLRLEADSRALEARGYERPSIERLHPGAGFIGAGLAMGAMGMSSGFAEPKIIATFQRRGARANGLPGQRAAALDAATFGCLSLAIVIGWTLAGVIVMVVGFVAIGALQPGATQNTPLATIPPLALVIIAVFGSIQSIRWLRTRG